MWSRASGFGAATPGWFSRTESEDRPARFRQSRRPSEPSRGRAGRDHDEPASQLEFGERWAGAPGLRRTIISSRGADRTGVVGVEADDHEAGTDQPASPRGQRDPSGRKAGQTGARSRTTPVSLQNHGTRAGGSVPILPAEYLLLTTSRCACAGGTDHPDLHTCRQPIRAG
jgi:hypothetical protein